MSQSRKGPRSRPLSGRPSRVPRIDAEVEAGLVQPLILSGGFGTRLWPLSRRAHPKQFLPLVDDTSLFQATCRRLADELFGDPVIIANDEHRFIVAEQMRCAARRPGAIVLEPVARNTAAAAIAGALIAAGETTDKLLLLLPSDHTIADDMAFTRAVRDGIAAARKGAIVTFGVTPSSPHTGYGYVEVVAGSEPALDVARFVEKPDGETAAAYLASGRFLWNAGIFLFEAGTLIAAAERFCPEILAAARSAVASARADLDFLRLDAAAFAAAPSLSIDHAIMEKHDRIACVPLPTRWSDLGSWSEIWEASQHDRDGNAHRGDVRFLRSRNCYATSEEIAVSVLGLSDAVVAATRDAVLVASRHDAQAVKEIVAAYERDGREEVLHHRRVHRPWGWYERLAIGGRYQVKCIMVQPGAELSLQSHLHRSEHWVVVNGTVEVTVGDERRLLTENESTYVPVGSRHRLSNPGKIPAFLIEVQSGAYLGEDDIVRVEDRYGRQDASAAARKG